MTFQLLKFGIIGILSTLIHISVFSYLVSIYEFSTIISNVLAFLVALSFSFAGHYKITFKSQLAETVTETRVLKRLIRFFLSALTGLVLNIVIAYITIDILGLGLIYSVVLMGVLTPVFLFFVNKFWVFK